jgi:succinylglutamate desuccinylase
MNGAAPLSEAVRALAAGDFSALAARYRQAGFTVALPAPGMLQIGRPAARGRAAVLLSAGVHGDETGPIELLAQILEALAPSALAVDLMLVIGNLEAIAVGKRFIEADLNRLFRAERGDLAQVFETARADLIMTHSRAFFAAAGSRRWHLDLHTAIRPSYFPLFAIVPELLAAGPKEALIAWLGRAGIGAVIINPSSAGTFSYYTAEQCASAGATLELGRVGLLGHNDLRQFDAARLALEALLQGRASKPGPLPQLFSVAQQIVKRSAAFALGVERATQNFTTLPKGTVIATDGDLVHTVQAAQELLVFPNPDVRIGQRAALTVVPRA